eukprot:Gregarina_sp_Pseudo_9__1808@NODE_222_length_3540_cov_142_790917_g89_i1_p3_GENE_NODE_222_length_3540_cov_142_790917_g89_i1NODE_222_length_3540_cov_142_790917_g89_i1_p3_ORF_typecomplete_len228_score25_89_NODE_222_length_3540_cov_142_790917_g89_i127573440
MRFHFLFALTALQTQAQEFTNFVVLTDREECKIPACQFAGDSLTLENLEACQAAAPTDCGFEVEYTVAVGTTDKVCTAAHGFSTADMLPSIGTPVAWTAGHTPSFTVYQDSNGDRVCTYSIRAAETCDDAGTHIVTLADTQPLNIPFSLLPVALPPYIRMQNQGEHNGDCDSKVASVDFWDLAITLSLGSSPWRDPINDSVSSLIHTPWTHTLLFLPLLFSFQPSLD